eukprot:7734482-Karenia_brevis.AAC.1
MLQLSDPSIFMMLGMAEVKFLNDLIFFDYLTDDSTACDQYPATDGLQQKDAKLCSKHGVAVVHG